MNFFSSKHHFFFILRYMFLLERDQIFKKWACDSLGNSISYKIMPFSDS